MQTYCLQVWGAKKKKINRIKYSSISKYCTKKIINALTILRSNIMLHNDPNIKAIQKEAIRIYKRLQTKFTDHLNPLLIK